MMRVLYFLKKGVIENMANMSSTDIDRYLRGVNYPADKNELVNYARKQNAPQDVVKNLDMLPNQRFSSPDDVRRNMQEGSSRSEMGSSRESSSGTGSSTTRQSRY